MLMRQNLIFPNSTYALYFDMTADCSVCVCMLNFEDLNNTKDALSFVEISVVVGLCFCFYTLFTNVNV